MGLTPEQQRRFTQLHAATNRATTYFRSGGRSTALLTTVLCSTSPDLTRQEVEGLVFKVLHIETKHDPKEST